MFNLFNLTQKSQIVILVVALVVFASIPSVYFYNKYQAAEKLLKNPQEVLKTQNSQLLKKIEKHMVLPAGEEPTFATVSDKDKLKDQAFFEKSENGDKVVIYTKAKKAILFRPLLDRIIDVAPVNFASESASVSANLNKQQIFNLVVLNGTKTIGLTKTAEENIMAKSQSYKILDRDDAKKKDYQKTTVVDLTGKNSTEALELAKIVGGEVASLPKEETKPKEGEFLVILGADYKK